jgi:hypothetical protein
MHIEDIKSKYHYFFTESTTFFCGQGWASILDRLFDQITYYNTVTENRYRSDIRFNHMFLSCQQGNWELFDQYYYNWDTTAKNKMRELILLNGPRIVNPVCTPLVIDKIDEHAGSLTISYKGGNDVIHGMILLAVSMSRITCEKCGHPGTTRGQGWKYTSCDEHATEPNLKFFEDAEGKICATQ